MDVNILLLTENNDEERDQLLIFLHGLNSIMLTLQENRTTRQLASKLFDGVITKLGRLKDRFVGDATIVDNVHFKCAIFKIQFGSEHSLSMKKIVQCGPLEKPPPLCLRKIN